MDPNYPLMDLDEAIRIAVQLRSDEGVVALSGGVDSALVARLAGRECVVVGIAGSHDLLHASQVAEEFGLTLHQVIIDPASIEDALAQVLAVIPKKDPVNASIATTLYFVCQWAGRHGERASWPDRQRTNCLGATPAICRPRLLPEDLERDFQGLASATGQRSGRCRTARRILLSALHGHESGSGGQGHPAADAGEGGVRKRPLRAVAERHMPPAIARYEKKAMQYGSGVMKEIQRLAARKGYRRSVQDYLHEICKKRGPGHGMIWMKWDDTSWATGEQGPAARASSLIDISFKRE